MFSRMDYQTRRFHYGNKWEALESIHPEEKNCLLVDVSQYYIDLFYCNENTPFLLYCYKDIESFNFHYFLNQSLIDFILLVDKPKASSAC